MFNLRKFIFLLLGICGNAMVYAQNGLGDPSDNQQAFDYFQAGQYHDVISLFEDDTDKSSDTEILFLLSKLKTGKDEKTSINQWMSENPKHPLQSLARFSYGEYAFYAGDTTTSKSYLAQVKSPELSTKDQASYGYVYGVLNLKEARYKNADNLFKFAAQKGFNNNSQLTYYQSFTKYHLNELDVALKGFEKVKSDEDYGTSSKFFIAKIQFESGNYDDVISLSQSELSEEQTKMNAGFHQIIGEAYALKNEVNKADAYFEQAIALHPGRPNPALYYQAGVSKFKIGNEDKALEFLTEAGIGAGPYAKLSAFQLGRLHIKRKEPELALTAYMEASSSDDEEIKRESIYQSAKLNAELERYPEAISYSQDYLDLYGTDEWGLDLENLIAQCYLKTSDYDQAITRLERKRIGSEILKDVYQKVTFQKAVLLFNDAKFSEAAVYFLKSLNHPINVELRGQCRYYLGEIEFRKGNYIAAINYYQRQSNKSGMTYYGIGYAHFNQQQYARAIEYFIKAKDLTTSNIQKDATLRLADCYYAEKDYAEALRYYETAGSSDYVNYQKGLVLSNLNRFDEAKVALGLVSTSSGFKDDAVFASAKLAFERAKFEDAEKGFSTLIEYHKSSQFLAEAYLNRGISRSNLQKLENAKADYEYVIQNFIQDEAAFNAILGLQDLQQKGVQVRELDQSIQSYKEANPGDNSLEVVEFESAKRLYFDSDYSGAIAKFTNFLNDYQESGLKNEGIYYLADAYYRSDNWLNAKEEFLKLKEVRNVFSSRVLTRLGTIHISLDEYTEAISVYRQLISLNSSPKDTYNAQFGLMEAFYLSSKYRETVQQADLLMQLEWKPLNAEQSATFYKAQSWMQLNDLSNARGAYKVLSTGEDEIAANSTYHLALIDYTQSRHQESLDILFDLNARFGSYSDWIDKSYLLIADNYIAIGELFQAKATLRSIVQHSQNEETRMVAQQALLGIEQVNEVDTVEVKDNE